MDPIGDASRAILDGHIVLSRPLATAGHFPAIDVLESISRVGPAVTTAEQRAAATQLRRLLAAYREAKDLIEIGAYVTGTNPLVDQRRRTPRSNGWLPPTGRVRVDSRAGCVGMARAHCRGDRRVKRFRFRLEQVLHVRRVQEDQAKAALLTANRAARRCRVARRHAPRRVPHALVPARRAVIRRVRAQPVPARQRGRCGRRRARRAPRRARGRRRPARRRSPQRIAASWRSNGSKRAGARSTSSRCAAPTTDWSTTSSSLVTS